MGIESQINKYKGAVGKRNVGSDPSPQAVADTKNTAIGRNRGTINTSAPRLSKPKGSWEGYMGGGYSAHIQMNGTGYDAPSAQKARGARIPKNFSQTPTSSFSANARQVGMFDLRNCASGKSSQNVLKKLTKLNKLF